VELAEVLLGEETVVESAQATTPATQEERELLNTTSRQEPKSLKALVVEGESEEPEATALTVRPISPRLEATEVREDRLMVGSEGLEVEERDRLLTDSEMARSVARQVGEQEAQALTLEALAVSSLSTTMVPYDAPRLLTVRCPVR
jgi:hypothetical protein